MGVYGAIELRVVYIGHYGTGVYDCNRLHYGRGCMSYAAPWFRGTVWGVNEAPATHMAPPVTRVTSARDPTASSYQSVVWPKIPPLFVILEALVS